MHVVEALFGIAFVIGLIWLGAIIWEGQHRSECTQHVCPDSHTPIYIKGRCVCLVEALVPEG
jgi:hypothetical protein